MARGRPTLSLLEAALLLSLLAVVTAVFVPTFIRRVRTDKIAEASTLLAEMSRRVAAYYETSWPSGKRQCLPAPAGPTPEQPSVDSQEVDFRARDIAGHASWEALGFQPDRPVRFSYRYLPSRAGCELGSLDEPITVVLRAEGDLDGDGVRSTFERRALVDREGFTPAEALLVHRRTE